MSKVIQSFIHLVLHRGLEVISKDLFLFKLIPRVITNISHGVIPRCSGTFSSRLFFRKKSLTKETSKKFELKVNSNSNFDYYLNRNKFVRIIGFTTSFSFILLTILSVFPIINHEESVEATYTPANPPTVTITSSSNIASVDITPTSSDGTFASSTSASEVAFGVTTDNLTGYTVAVSARSGDTLGQLTNASYGDTLDTISTITSETDFSTNSTYTNQWGIKPSKYVDTSTGTVIDNTSSTINYLPAPTTSELVLDTTNTPNPTTANNYTIGLGARVDYTKPVGTYTNTYVLQAVGNQISYQINYRDNSSGSDVVWNTEGTSNITASSFTLLSTTPTRTGYDFVGWCYGTVNHTTNPSTCTGTVYQPGETFTFSSLSTTTTNTANIYAMWILTLYSKVASMSKGTQTVAQLKDTITQPTSTDPTTDTSNSGVFEYDASVFGVATDANNTKKIYYYRGILDTSGNTGTYGSDGKANAYPNYVRLGNLCWRIIRTTGSGGVKMIYNGLYSATTSGSCANATTNAQLVSLSGFNGTSTTYQQVVLAGYTYNDTYASNTNTNRQAGVLFGTNSNYSGNSTNSTMKTAVENWYNSNLNSYTSYLEPSAGYCGDRTLYHNGVQPESTSIAQYSTSTTVYYFGAGNRINLGAPSLTCAKDGNVDRSIVDLYTTSSASNGNKQLVKPVALITTDETSFAGSVGGSNYHNNSYLHTGTSFYYLSPFARMSNGNTTVCGMNDNGTFGYATIYGSMGVRPVISLAPGTKIVSGNGTATNPWQVNW